MEKSLQRIIVRRTISKKEKKTRIDTVSKAEAAIPKTAKILKNLARVIIDDQGNLVFNKHELGLMLGQHIMLKPMDGKGMIRSAYKSPNRFVFSDGSIVEINKAGFFVLISSDDRIPKIFVPAVLDAALGVATTKVFAGNTYYQHVPLYQLVINSLGEDHAFLIEQLHYLYGIGSAFARALNQQLPQKLGAYLDYEKATQYKSNLDAFGAKIELVPVAAQQSGLSVEETSVFFEKYIKGFVKTIQDYGANN